MGIFGLGGRSGQHDQAQRNGQRAWEELQETREEVQGALQHEAGHVKEKADEQARGVKRQLEHLKGKADDAAERGRQTGEQHADEVTERASDTGSWLRGKSERGANAVAERASRTIDTVRDKARRTKEGAKDQAWRTEETVEDRSQQAKQGVKAKWWEKKERADQAAEEASQKTRSNIHAAERTTAEKAEEAKRAAAEKAEQAKEVAQRGAQRVKSAAERSRDKLGEVKGKVGDKGQQLKGRVEETAEDIEEGAERTKEAAARKAEEAKRTAAKPFRWLGRTADEGTDKAAEGVGAAKGVVSGTAQEAREAGRGLGGKLDRSSDKVAEGAGYVAGYVEETAEEVAHGAKRALGRARDVVGDDVRVTVKRVETPFISIHSKTVKELLAGGIAGAIAQTSATPLEVVRTKLLGGRSGDNIKEVVKTLNRSKGRDWPIQQTTGSFGVNVLRVALTKSVELVTYEKVKAKLKRRGRRGDHQIPLLDKLPRQVPESTWAGAAAGLANTLVAYPFETLKDRVLVMPEQYKGFGDAFRQVMLREGGLPALYRGVVPALLGIVPQSAVNYYVYDTLKERYRKRTGRKHVPAAYTLLFGATAGAVSQLATYPLEVARKQVSVSVLPAVETGKAANAAYRNVVEAVRGVVRTEGVAGLYKGVGAQVAQVVPVAGLSWVVFETAKRALQAEEEDED